MYAVYCMLFTLLINLRHDYSVLSLDVEKAFNRLEWGYVGMVLEQFEFNHNFISMIKTLYNDPTGSCKLSPFPLKCRSKQGLSYVPLLLIWLSLQLQFMSLHYLTLCGWHPSVPLQCWVLSLSLSCTSVVWVYRAGWIYIYILTKSMIFPIN